MMLLRVRLETGLDNIKHFYREKVIKTPLDKFCMKKYSNVKYIKKICETRVFLISYKYTAVPDHT